MADLHATLKKSLLEKHYHDATAKQAALDMRANHVILFTRKKSSALLVAGSIFGLLGFLFAFLIGFMKFVNPQLSEFHQRFPSGYGYFPATVSEMVHDPQEPAGKCFFAFEFVGALLIFQSWYPWELRNVYIGDSHLVPFTRMSWSMFRQFVPPLGMVLVATITSTPFPQATPLDFICIAIHLTGAMMLFVGYAVVEAYSLGFCVKQTETMVKVLSDGHSRERCLRYVFLASLVCFYTTFCIVTALVVLPLEAWGGKNDVWEKRHVQTDTGAGYSKMVLVDTASGFVLGLKILSYVSEVFCGLCLIGSFLTIWYFCEERHTDLADELFDVRELEVAASAQDFTPGHLENGSVGSSPTAGAVARWQHRLRRE